MTRPIGETKQDRRRQRVVGIGVILIFGLLLTNVGQGVMNYDSQVNHHAASVRNDKEILGLLQTVKQSQDDHATTLAEIKQLEVQVATVIEGLPIADSELASFAKWLEICIGTDHELACPAPPIPTS